MKFKISFIENIIETDTEYVRCIEIENKNYFYRVVSLLNNFDNGVELQDEIDFIDKIDYKLITDYFNIDLNDKKTLNVVVKYIKENIDGTNYDKLLKSYQRLSNLFSSSLDNIDLPIYIEEDVNIDSIIKLMNIKIKKEDNILKNLFILIEIIKELQNYNLLVLVNLKQYLTKEELNEFYKYAIYNKVALLLIDNLSYGIAQKYEKKLLIDDNLEEYVV